MHICYVYIYIHMYIGSRLKGETCSHPTNMWVWLKRSPQKKNIRWGASLHVLTTQFYRRKNLHQSLWLRLYGEIFVKNPNRLTKSVGTDLSTPITLGPHFYCHGHIWFATKAQQTSPGPGTRNSPGDISSTLEVAEHRKNRLGLW